MKAWLRGAMWRLIFATMIVGAGAIYSVANNFTLTQGAGTTFASLLISTINYPIHLLCDATAGETQCQAVDSSGNAAVKDAAVLAAVQAPVTFPTLALGSTLVSGTTAAMTGTTSTQVIAAVASKVLYVTRIKCNNSSSTQTLVQIQDGSGGTTLDTLLAGANGGEQGNGSTPLFWTTAGNALFAKNVTTGANTFCTGSGYSG